MKPWRTALEALAFCGLVTGANAGGITISPVPNQPYTQYSFTATGNGGDVIFIGMRNDTARDGLDNVSVTDASGTNLLLNGSFETGDFTGWSSFANFTNTSVVSSYPSYAPQDGSYFVAFGPQTVDGFIYQDFTDTPGETLTFSAWVAGDGSAPSVFCMMSELEGTSCAPGAAPMVPEPLTLSLFGMGLAAMGFLGLRRRQ